MSGIAIFNTPQYWKYAICNFNVVQNLPISNCTNHEKCVYARLSVLRLPIDRLGDSVDKLRHPKSDAYSAEQVLLHKQLIWCGRAYPDCYPRLKL